MKKYSLWMRLMHWILGATILGVLTVGFYMAGLPGDNQLKWQLYSLHKSFGVIIFALVILRVIIRLSSEIPNYPKEVSNLEVKLSCIAISILYLGMFVMPLSGYISSTAGGYGVQFFSFNMPSFFSEKNFEVAHIAHTIHNYTAYFLIAIVGLHIIAPFKHLLIDKVNIFKRIV